jgi:hypothetical protein
MAPINYARRPGISISVSPTALPTAKPMSAYRPGVEQTSIGSIPLSCALRKRAFAFRCSPVGGAFRLCLCLRRRRESLRRPSCLRRRRIIVPRANGAVTWKISLRSSGRPGLTWHARSGTCCRARARRGRTGSSGSTAATMRGRLAEVSTRLCGWCGACDQRLDRWPRPRLSAANRPISSIWRRNRTADRRGSAVRRFFGVMLQAPVRAAAPIVREATRAPVAQSRRRIPG